MVTKWWAPRERPRGNGDEGGGQIVKEKEQGREARERGGEDVVELKEKEGEREAMRKQEEDARERQGRAEGGLGSVGV